MPLSACRSNFQTEGHLGYVHACENQRGIPGTGLTPWVPSFHALEQVGYDECVTIESFDPNMESITKLCCIWRKLADSPEQLATEGLRFLKDVYRQVYLGRIGRRARLAVGRRRCSGPGSACSCNSRRSVSPFLFQAQRRSTVGAIHAGFPFCLLATIDWPGCRRPPKRAAAIAVVRNAA